MTAPGGSRIRLLGSEAESSSGCLVRFVDQPDRVLMLGAAHGLVRRNATQADRVEASDAPGSSIGTLLTWSTFNSAISADVALFWVEPDRVSPEIRGLGRPATLPNLQPHVGMTLRLCPRIGESSPRRGRVAQVRRNVTLPVTGPDWHLQQIVYVDHIICEPMFTRRGDSGAVVLDEEGRLVGMVVGGRPLVDLGNDRWTSQSVITPINAILGHPDFQERLEILNDMPSDARGPT